MVDKAIDGRVTEHDATVFQRQCDPMLDADGVFGKLLRAGRIIAPTPDPGRAAVTLQLT